MLGWLCFMVFRLVCGLCCGFFVIDYVDIVVFLIYVDGLIYVVWGVVIVDGGYKYCVEWCIDGVYLLVVEEEVFGYVVFVMVGVVCVVCYFFGV